MPTIDELLQALSANQLLNSELFAEQDLDAVLDLRDSEPFDSAWIASFNAIASQWQAADMQPTAVDALRQQAFLHASRHTQQHEIASYISDDFELIGKMLLLQLDEPFIAHLLHEYQQQRLPANVATAQ